MLKNSLDVKLELETPVFDKRLYTTSLSKEEQCKHRSFKAKYEKRCEVSHLKPILVISCVLIFFFIRGSTKTLKNVCFSI